tara:strand:- start:5826 stop:6005 length:180 start_codon:yes stop_codon:yes gene_type:complete
MEFYEIFTAVLAGNLAAAFCIYGLVQYNKCGENDEPRTIHVLQIVIPLLMAASGAYFYS